MQARHPRAGEGFVFIAIFLAALAQSAAAAGYQPQQQVSGDIRIWGSPEDRGLISLWEEGFRRRQPQARVVARLPGPESTIAGIYTGVADIAFVGRDLRQPTDNRAFQWAQPYRPTRGEVANGGVKSKR